MSKEFKESKTRRNNNVVIYHSGFPFNEVLKLMIMMIDENILFNVKELHITEIESALYSYQEGKKK